MLGHEKSWFQKRDYILKRQILFEYVQYILFLKSELRKKQNLQQKINESGVLVV